MKTCSVLAAAAAVASALPILAQDTIRAPHDPTIQDTTWWVEIAGRPDASTPAGVLIRADGQKQQIARNPAIARPAGWSPDGRRQVSVVRDRGPERDLVQRPVRAGVLVSGAQQAELRGEVRLTNDHDDLDPFWSKDGGTIYFRSNRGGDGWQLWRIDANGGEPQRMTEGDAKVHEAVLSPDGTQVLLNRATPRPRELRQGMRTVDRDVTILEVATGELRTLLDDLFTLDFAWSPDGACIVCGADADIVFLDAGSGRTVRKLASREVHEAAYAHGASGFVWRPDSAAVACKLSFLGQTMVMNGEEPKLFGDDEVFVIPLDGAPITIPPPQDPELNAIWSGRAVAWRRLPA